MKEKRGKHEVLIAKHKAAGVKEKEEKALQAREEEEREPRQEQAQADEEAVNEAFSEVIAQKKRTKPFVASESKKKRPKISTKDEQNYIPYVAKDHHGESGYALLSKGSLWELCVQLKCCFVVAGQSCFGPRLWTRRRGRRHGPDWG